MRLVVLLATKDVFYDRLSESANQTEQKPKTSKSGGKNEKFPRYFKNHKNLKSSEKIEIHAVGYSTHQQL